MAPRITTLLVDDAPDIRELLRVALRARGGFDVVGETGTGAEAVRLARTLRPDVVVLDLGMPDVTDKELLADLRRESPTTRIVIFSGSDTDRAWFEQRSEGYVLKGSRLADLIDVLADADTSPDRDQAVLELPHDVVAVREARALVRQLLLDWGYDDLIDDATLVVSELVTNAVAHTRSNFAVVVNRSGGGVRIEVRDQGPGTPDPKPFSDSAEDGRGLMIVSALASAWGVDTAPPSKTVWVELSTR
jgi:CheY-like chemotaxis protein